MRPVTLMAWSPVAPTVRARLAKYLCDGLRWQEVSGPLITTFLVCTSGKHARTIRRQLPHGCSFEYGHQDDDEIFTPLLQHMVLAVVVLMSALIAVRHLAPHLLR